MVNDCCKMLPPNIGASARRCRTPLHVLIGLVPLALSSCSNAPDSSNHSIEPFSSDKCSYYAEGTITEQNLWCHCCVQHDIYYWMGGTEQQRSEADDTFKQCIKDSGAPANAQLMWLGVRLGGGPISIADHRWGFGWPDHRSYQALSDEEQSMLAKKLAGLDETITSYCSTGADRKSPVVESGTLKNAD